jgi:type IV pilus assembly protein PilN
MSSTVRINLRPWREELREERKKLFFILAGVCSAAAVLLSLLIWEIFNLKAQNQKSRNQLIVAENAKLDAQLQEIGHLEKRREDMVSQLEVIQGLQGNRPIIVRVFDALVRTLPDGVYFSSIQMTGNQIAIVGRATSNSQISALMRQLDGSDWFDAPSLKKVTAAGSGTEGSEGYYQFDLTVMQVKPESEARNAEADSGEAI